jgi:hypothetical protein
MRTRFPEDEPVPDTRIIKPGETCGALAVQGITEIYLRELSDKERTMDLKPGDLRRPKFEVRTGIAIFGHYNSGEAIENPFHPMFRNNWASGTGNTEEEALESLLADIRGTSEMILTI